MSSITFSNDKHFQLSHQAKKSEETRKKIIDSAIDLLETKGYSKTNLADIAKGANMTIGALQHHFPSKNALLEVLVTEVLSPLDSSSFSSVWQKSFQGLPERTDHFVDEVWNQIYGNKRYIATWSLVLGCRAEKKLFDLIQKHRSQNDPIFNNNFLNYFPEIKNKVQNPEYFASYIYSTLRGMAILEIFSPEKNEVTTQLNFIKEIIQIYANK